ncbi:MAG: NAD(P)/FAD-dependent oxidoreductase [Acidimicrobiaceae bacterium]|nr:NAD(P)/FAD-dependent oxidoreductase [Acidimicrobiaceae bacterium]
MTADAVVIGSGPNGLVAANILAGAGWEVTVLEAAAHPGGGVASADYLGPGYVADICSAFYPLVAASPVFRSLDLEDFGLQWRHAPAVLAHPLPDGDAAVLSRDFEATVDDLERRNPGDGAAWRRLWALWERAGDGVLRALLTPFPPLRATGQLAAALRTAGLLRLGRLVALPVRRLAEEDFAGTAAGLLLAGCAMHSDLTPEAPPSAAIGWILTMLGHQVGFPVPEGGAGALTASLVRRLESLGGRVMCGQRVTEVVVRGGSAVGVRTAEGADVDARRAVVADVAATELFGSLVPKAELPATMLDDLRRFQWDNSTVKVDWALRAPVPWSSRDLGRAGTVHLADSMDDLTQYSADLAMGLVPAKPFLVMGQMRTADPTRSPPGTEVVWAYTHVPQRIKGDAGREGVIGTWDPTDTDAMVSRIEQRIEQFAPGFSRLITARHVMTPPDLEAHNRNLVGGAINGGTSAMHQQLMFRPTPGLGRPETPVAGLYLASSAAHPGGGVHGACGANAARAALRGQSRGRLVSAPLLKSRERHAWSGG